MGEEEKYLRSAYQQGVPLTEICKELGRTRWQVKGRAERLGISRDEESLSSLYFLGGKKNKGRKRPDFLKNRYVAQPGSANPFYGRTHSPAVKRLLSNQMKQRCADPEFHKKRLATLKARGGRNRECPNSYERKLGEILETLFPGEYKFVGDWSFIIERKNPDFVNVNGQKKVIELFGEVYHDPNCSPWDLKDGRTAAVRVKLFSKYGYQTLIVWCKELGDVGSLGEKLRRFHEDLCY